MATPPPAVISRLFRRDRLSLRGDVVRILKPRSASRFASALPVLGEVGDEHRRYLVPPGQLALAVHAPIADHEVELGHARGNRLEELVELSDERRVLLRLVEHDRDTVEIAGRGRVKLHRLLAARQAQSQARAQRGAARLAGHALDHDAERRGPAAQRRGDVACRRRPALGLVRETTLHQLRERGRHVRTHRGKVG
jgi:hypothetical protein